MPDDQADLRRRALLAQAHVIHDKHTALAAANGQGFNLFAILRRATDEVHTHSAILAELLDPHGTHGQGAAFARLFLSRIALRHEDLDPVDIDNATVWRERTVARKAA